MSNNPWPFVVVALLSLGFLANTMAQQNSTQESYQPGSTGGASLRFDGNDADEFQDRFSGNGGLPEMDLDAAAATGGFDRKTTNRADSSWAAKSKDPEFDAPFSSNTVAPAAPPRNATPSAKIGSIVSDSPESTGPTTKGPSPFGYDRYGQQDVASGSARSAGNDSLANELDYWNNGHSNNQAPQPPQHYTDTQHDVAEIPDYMRNSKTQLGGIQPLKETSALQGSQRAVGPTTSEGPTSVLRNQYQNRSRARTPGSRRNPFNEGTTRHVLNESSGIQDKLLGPPPTPKQQPFSANRSSGEAAQGTSTVVGNSPKSVEDIARGTFNDLRGKVKGAIDPALSKVTDSDSSRGSGKITIDGTDTNQEGGVLDDRKLPLWPTMALFASLAANVFFGWIAWDTHSRYQDFVDEMNESDTRRERRTRRLREEPAVTQPIRTREQDEADFLRGGIEV